MIKIVKATKKDKKRIGRFYKQQRYSASFVGYDECYLIELNNEYTGPNNNAHEHQIIAAVMVSMSNNVNQQPWLHSLVVNTDNQRQSLASALIKKVLQHYDELVCFADLSLIPLYQKLGFSTLITAQEKHNQITDKSPSLALLSATNLKRYQQYLTTKPKLIALYYAKVNDQYNEYIQYQYRN